MPRLKAKTITKPQNLRQVLSTSINYLMNQKILSKMEIERHRTIGYLCSIALNVMKESEIQEQIDMLKEELESVKEMQRE